VTRPLARPTPQAHPAPPPAPAPARPPGPGAAARWLARLDAAANRIYGPAHNPLYRSGTLTVALLLILIATGLYLLLFYRIGAPYASVARITEQAWLGRWIRTAHRLAADAAVGGSPASASSRSSSSAAGPGT
jgi:hypothetical protein